MALVGYCRDKRATIFSGSRTGKACRTQNETEKLAIAYEARAIERGDDIDEWLTVAGLWEELGESERILEVLTLGASANPGMGVSRFDSHQCCMEIWTMRAWEVLNEALRHLEHDSDAAFKIFGVLLIMRNSITDLKPRLRLSLPSRVQRLQPRTRFLALPDYWNRSDVMKIWRSSMRN